MNSYKLNFNIPSPGDSLSFIEFSPDGRLLAVGDRDRSVLFILDKLAGFHPTISFITLAIPTALVWETTETFYVGLSDGNFVHYRINLKDNTLVEGVVDSSLYYEGFPITAMALDVGSKTLIMSVGPGVFAFRRICATSKFHFVARLSTRFHFKSDPGTPAPPFPRSICFAPNNVLIITFCRQYIASIVLEFDGNQLHSSFQTAQIDYSGLPLLKAITSANEEGIHQLTRVWVYGNASETGGGSFPFLFINGGAATLSGSPFGAAIIRDTITHREIQLLEHAVAGHAIAAMAYHVSNNSYNIATTSRGVDATIKIWTAQRPSLRSQVQHGPLVQKGWAVATLVAAFIIAMLTKTGILLDIKEVLWLCVQSMLAFAKVGIKTGYLALDAAEDAAVDAGGITD